MTFADSTAAEHTAAAGSMISGATALVRVLEDLGVETVFGYPGGAIMPVYDALKDSRIRHILTRHEQGAALAADAWGRVTGKAGVCLATSGPGATNLVTGIANAYLDSAPMVAITGQVASPLMGTDAFQEVDIFGITMPIVKHSFLIRSADDIADTIREAFAIAEGGRPGPVLIDLPKDVTLQEVRYSPVRLVTPEVRDTADRSSIGEARELLEKAERPLFYVGGGVAMADAVEELRSIVTTTGLPVVCTLKALGAIPTTDPQFLGMLGMHGSKAANQAVQECDLLICVGARFDDRATGNLAGFAPDARVIHMDTDEAEIGKLRTADVGLRGCLRTSLIELAPRCVDSERWFDWRQKCLVARSEDIHRYDEAPATSVYAPELLALLSRKAGPDAIVTCDVGQHQMWVAQHCEMHHPRRHLTSGGLGTMGYGIPAGIGAWFASPGTTVVTVTGDGSIMMNIQELATLKRYGIGLRIVVLDNSALGMVRQWQELFFDGNYSEVDLSDNPDFASLARAFGIEGISVTSRRQVPAAIDHLLATEGPALLHVPIDMAENVWPLVPPGKANHEMMTKETSK